MSLNPITIDIVSNVESLNMHNQNITNAGNIQCTTINGGSPISGGITGVTASSPILSSGGLIPNISLPQCSGSVNGYLGSSDWSTFNGKVSNPMTSNLATGGFAFTGNVGFYGVTPVARATTAISPATYNNNLGAIATVNDTAGGYTFAQVVAALKNMGILT